MPNRATIYTDEAPAAIGTYSQAVSVNGIVYLSGQIPLVPNTMELVAGGFSEQAEQMFKNLSAVCEAAGGSLDKLVKLNLYLTDLENFSMINNVMATFFSEPYPARAAIGVSQLPKNALIEADGIMVI